MARPNSKSSNNYTPTFFLWIIKRFWKGEAIGNFKSITHN